MTFRLAMIAPFMLLVAAQPALPVDDPSCLCWLTSGGQVPGVLPPAECVPASFTISFGIGNSENGLCYSVDPQCETRNCSATIKVLVSGQGPCRIRIWKNLTDIGGGWLPNGGEFDLTAGVDLECGDFDVFAFIYGGAAMTSITYLCESCAGAQ